MIEASKSLNDRRMLQIGLFACVASIWAARRGFRSARPGGGPPGPAVPLKAWVSERAVSVVCRSQQPRFANFIAELCGAWIAANSVWSCTVGPQAPSCDTKHRIHQSPALISGLDFSCCFGCGLARSANAPSEPCSNRPGPRYGTNHASSSVRGCPLNVAVRSSIIRLPIFAAADLASLSAPQISFSSCKSRQASALLQHCFSESRIRHAFAITCQT